ncbi:MAG: histidine phosphatase family protein [Anaerolineales bacterium]|nr:histidine phosphatase family protein [Anaerolineales bacterium]
MQFYFIRHAQSQNNLLYDLTGSGTGRSQDPELTDTGSQQAQYLADFIRDAGPGAPADISDPQNTMGFGLTHLYTSLMIRSVSTGIIIAQETGLPLLGWRDLHEGGGVYLHDEETGEPVGLPGNNRTYFNTYYPTLVLEDDIDELGWWNRPFETRPERRERARRVIRQLLAQHGSTNHRVAVISHGGFFNHLMAVLVGLSERADLSPSLASTQALAAENVILSAEREVWFTMNNTAIARIDITPEENRLIYLNRLDFLPPELIT